MKGPVVHRIWPKVGGAWTKAVPVFTTVGLLSGFVQVFQAIADGEISVLLTSVACLCAVPVVLAAPTVLRDLRRSRPDPGSADKVESPEQAEAPRPARSDAFRRLLVGCVVVTTGSVVLTMASVFYVATAGPTRPSDPGRQESATAVAGPTSPEPVPQSTESFAPGYAEPCSTDGSPVSAEIRAVWSKDGRSGLSGDLWVEAVVQELPLDGHKRWLVSKVTNGDANFVYVVKDEVPAALGAHKLDLKLPRSAAGSERDLMVVEGDSSSQVWLEENKAHDGDPTWDENRLKLPAGVEQVSNQCHVKKTRQ